MIWSCFLLDEKESVVYSYIVPGDVGPAIFHLYKILNAIIIYELEDQYKYKTIEFASLILNWCNTTAGSVTANKLFWSSH